MTPQEFGSALFEIRINTHIAHLQTTSLAEHLALGDLYSKLEELQDSFTETYQGIYGVITGYPKFTTGENIDMITYLTVKCGKFTVFRNSLKEGFLQNIVDTIIELLYTTLYKLKTLN